MTSISDFQMSKEIGRVPSSTVPLDSQEEIRFEGLVEDAVMIDVHQHPFVLPEAMDRFVDFLRTNRYHWGFEAVRHGGWSTV
ncbi:MAG: diguanylate cyclase, partial [Chloroflexi bacterium]|nr:diguanylate cyclase [Chloroflexota bacterium]